MRIWPAIVAPLGLTLLLAVAAWLFLAKVHADQEQADAAALRLEGYARLEAGELTGRALTLCRGFIDERMRKRSDQEKNMRIELRSVMDAVYRVLTAGLEKTRSAASSSRAVGEFPSGFESLRLFLELSDGGSSTEDAPVEALRACATELSALLPSGCSLSVVENNFEELLALGGGTPPENVRAETIAREFIWDDGTQNRHWTLQVRLSEADEHPLPDARELADHLDSRMGATELADVSWRGWLVDASGEAVAAFPAAVAQGTSTRKQADVPPPYIDMPGEWVEVDGKRLVWLEKSARLEMPLVTPSIAVAIDRPAAPLVWNDELLHDRRWGMTLGILGLLSLGTWIWFARALWMSRRRAATGRLENLVAGGRQLVERSKGSVSADRPAALAAAVAAVAGAGAGYAAGREGAGRDAARRRLVRDDSASVRSSDEQGVIVAEIGDNGEVEVGAEIITQTPRHRVVMPSGSLLRLQERHRGGAGRRSSRVLDQARSPLVRELAKRVRPVLTAPQPHVQSQPVPKSQSVPQHPQAYVAAQSSQKTVSTPRRTGRATEKIVRK